MSWPRVLTDGEIEFTVSALDECLRANNTLTTPDLIALEHQKEIIREVLRRRKFVAPEAAVEFRRRITDKFTSSLISPHFPIGVSAAQTSSEYISQRILKSTHKAGQKGENKNQFSELVSLSHTRSVEYIHTGMNENLPTLAELMHGIDVNFVLSTKERLYDACLSMCQIEFIEVVYRQKGGSLFSIREINGVSAVVVRLSTVELFKRKTDVFEFCKMYSFVISLIPFGKITPEYSEFYVHPDNVSLHDAIGYIISLGEYTTRDKFRSFTIEEYPIKKTIKRIVPTYPAPRFITRYLKRSGAAPQLTVLIDNHHTHVMTERIALSISQQTGVTLVGYDMDLSNRVTALHYASLPPDFIPTDSAYVAKLYISNGDKPKKSSPRNDMLFYILQNSLFEPCITYTNNYYVSYNLFGVDYVNRLVDWEWNTIVAENRVVQVYQSILVDYMTTVTPVGISYKSVARGTLVGATFYHQKTWLVDGAVSGSQKPEKSIEFITDPRAGIIMGSGSTCHGMSAVTVTVDQNAAKQILEDYAQTDTSIKRIVIDIRANRAGFAILDRAPDIKLPFVPMESGIRALLGMT